MGMTQYLANRRKYLENRPRFPVEELAKHAGAWVAWNPEGTRILESANDPDALEGLIQEAGEDPTYCVVEGIPAADSLIGGGSFNWEQP